jgi:O-antigen ligase
LLVLAFVIPLNKEFSSPSIALLLIAACINHKPWKMIFQDWKVLLPLLIFVVSATSLLYTTDLNAGISKLETKLSWLLFPLIIAISNLPFKKIIPNIVRSFVDGCFVAAVLSLINATVLYSLSGDLSHYFYGNFGFFHHTSYAGMYYAFALVIVYYYALKPSKKFHFKPFINFAFIVFFSICIALLVSRTALITVFFIHLFALGYWIFKHKKYLLGSLAVGGITFSFVLLLLISPTFKERVIGAFDFSSENETSASNTRFTLWKLNFDLAKEHLLLGVGEGDVQSLQEQTYFKAHNSALKNHFLNAHNQYIQTLVTTGMIGLLVLLYFFVVLFKNCWNTKFVIGSYFILLVFINFVTEAMLETQSGVIFIAFFTCLFWAIKYHSFQASSANEINSINSINKQ